MAEALSLSLAGGTMGVLLGIASAYALSAVLNWATVVSPVAVAMSFGFAALVGVVFGYVPARRAAALMPTEALAITSSSPVYQAGDFRLTLWWLDLARLDSSACQTPTSVALDGGAPHLVGAHADADARIPHDVVVSDAAIVDRQRPARERAQVIGERDAHRPAKIARAATELVVRQPAAFLFATELASGGGASAPVPRAAPARG